MLTEFSHSFRLTNFISTTRFMRIQNLPLWNRRSFYYTCHQNLNITSSPSSSWFCLMNMNINNNTTATTNCSATSSPSSNPTKTVRVMIKGRVQGVFYRNWTVENATGLGLKGWVRNRRDGSVEALFSGDPKSIDEMELRCRRGPPEAVVTGFQVFPSNEDLTGQESFHLKPTV
ncbi:Acylphosphatase [Thalictrum thalictroides]|uniref:acylphosphatase n=1 Tax=Thalictrum thalictroides TaxID=46969 RepID=A0A7J6WFQ1_THATH|nr:Acylphosphatase [Thalictrum thalictroides]